LDEADTELRKLGREGVTQSYLLRDYARQVLNHFLTRLSLFERFRLMKTLGRMNFENAPFAADPSELYYKAGDEFFAAANYLFEIKGEEQIQSALRDEGITIQDGPFDEAFYRLKLKTRAQPYLYRAINSYRYAAAGAFGTARARARLALADAIYGLPGSRGLAQGIFQAITREYISSRGPLEDYPYFMSAASKWALSLVQDSPACKSGGTPRNEDWDDVWVKLGAAKDHNICVLAKNIWNKEDWEKFGPMWRLLGRDVFLPAIREGSGIGEGRVLARKGPDPVCLLSQQAWRRRKCSRLHEEGSDYAKSDSGLFR
jgi:hypothetical protein